MAPWLIIVTGLIYTWTAGDLFMDGKPWHALMFFAYALGNVAIYKMVTE